MKKFMLTAVALVAMTSVSLAAGVAQLSDVKGKVLVNLGEGFVAASAATVLTPGAQIMVGEDSAAVISYLGSDCKVEVAPASITTVAEAAPCVDGQVVGSVDGVFVLPVADVIVAAPFPYWTLLIPVFPIADCLVTNIVCELDDNDNGLSDDDAGSDT